jgi:DNA-binding YbaB/EbfC family protein
MQFRGGMSELLRQASRMQRKIEEAKEAFKAHTFEVSGANEKIKVVANGAREIVSVHIDPEFLKSEDLGLVQDALVGVVNAALAKSNEQLEAHVNQVTGGVKIPGVT